MTADEIKALLPTATYPDLYFMVQDIRKALLREFPDCEKIERKTEPFKTIPVEGKPLDATIAFCPTDIGERYLIAIVAGKVENVIAGLEFSAYHSAWAIGAASDTTGMRPPSIDIRRLPAGCRKSPSIGAELARVNNDVRPLVSLRRTKDQPP